MPGKKHGFGPKNLNNTLNNLHETWVQMRNVLIGRYVEIPTQNGGSKDFKIVEIDLRFPLTDSIVLLDLPELGEYLGMRYYYLKELIVSGQARFNPSFPSLIPFLP